MDGKEKLLDLIKTEVGSALAGVKDELIKSANAEKLGIGGEAPAVHFKEKDIDPKVEFGRFVQVAMLSEKNPRQTPAEIAKALYPNDKLLNDAMGKAMGVTGPADGGFWVPDVLASETIPYLYAAIVVSGLGARRIPMPAGNINIPRIDAKATGYWVGENQKITKSQQTIGNVRLVAHKLAGLVPVSNDLLRSTADAAASFITNDLIRSIALKADYTFLYGPETEYAPAGLDTLLPSGQKIGSSSIPLLPDVLANMVAQVMINNPPGIAFGWTFNAYTWNWLYNLKTTTGAYIYRDEMSMNKTLLGHPFMISNQIVEGGNYGSGTGYSDIWFGDWSEAMIGEQYAMEVMTSREGTYFDGSTQVSAFAQDQTIIRGLTTLDFNIRHTGVFVKGTYKHALS